MDPTLFDSDDADSTAPTEPTPLRSPHLGSAARPATAVAFRDRLHTSPPRRAVLRMRLSQTELSDITTAATRVRLPPSGYAAAAATAAARDENGPHLDVLRAALIDLVDAREHLRQLTDAAASSHSSPLPNRVEAAAERAVAAVEDAAGVLVRSPRDQQRPQPPQRTQSRRGRTGGTGGMGEEPPRTGQS